jgi:hypothetical protein
MTGHSSSAILGVAWLDAKAQGRDFKDGGLAFAAALAGTPCIALHLAQTAHAIRLCGRGGRGYTPVTSRCMNALSDMPQGGAV